MTVQFVTVVVVHSHFDRHGPVRFIADVLGLARATDLRVSILAILEFIDLFGVVDDSQAADLEDVFSSVALLDFVGIRRLVLTVLRIIVSIGLFSHIVQLILEVAVKVVGLLFFVAIVTAFVYRTAAVRPPGLAGRCPTPRRDRNRSSSPCPRSPR